MEGSGTRRLFRSIVCPIDFSDQSAAALRHAAAIKRKMGGRLTALFVADPRLIEAAVNAYDERGLEQASIAQLRRFVSATLPRDAATDVRCVSALGKPAEEILAAAARVHADLIVVGTHGLSGARKLFFGSTTDRLLRTSGVPVLAIPASCSGPPRGWPGRLMIAALDLGPAGAAALDGAARVAAAFESPLLAVHVLQDIALPTWMQGNTAAYNRTRVDEAQARLAQLSLPAGRRVSKRVLIGDPPESIVALAVEEHVHLLMLPVSGRAGVLQPRLDGMAYRVLCYAPAPILTLPEAFTRPKRRTGSLLGSRRLVRTVRGLAT
jgi:nucleotide-binding universal stress UspA family protein